MSTSIHGFCGPLPEVINLTISSRSVAGKNEYFVSHQSKLWPNGSTITYSFLNGTNAQKSVVQSALPEFTTYANINFVLVDDSLERVGTDARSIEGQATMNLGLIDSTDPSDEDRAIALHEIGHALGFAHEWDGKNAAIVEKISPKDEGIAQHAQAFGDKVVSNFAEVDTKSIMTYFVPSRLSKDGAGIPPNLQLSESDKAWLSINYPGKNAVSNGEKFTTLRSLSILSIPAGVASQLLATNNISDMRSTYSRFVSSQTGDQKAIRSATQEEIFVEIASHFSQMGSPTMNLAAIHSSALPTRVTAPSSAFSDAPSALVQDQDIDQTLYDVFGSMVLNPQFQQAVINISTNDLTNHGVKISDYPIQNAVAMSDVQLQQGLLGALVPILTQVVGGVLGANGIQSGVQNGIASNAPLPANIQQGIFDAIGKFVQNPIFTSIVKGIVTTAAIVV